MESDLCMDIYCNKRLPTNNASVLHSLFHNKKEMEIRHFPQGHPLSLIDSVGKNISCNRCWTQLSGPTYVCRKCGLFFHKDCIDELKPEVQCLIHPCPLLLSTPGGMRRCCACNEYVVGISYRCKFRCYYYVHVDCAVKSMEEYADEEDSISHFTHPHPLKCTDFSQLEDMGVLRGSYHNQVYVCAICEKDCSSSPTNGCMECMFFLHKSCMKSIPGRLTNHLIHPCTLVINYNNDYNEYCAKCSEPCSERKWCALNFSCEPCCFHLHVNCALLSITESEETKEIQHFTHPHTLALIQNHQECENNPRCVACGQTCLPSTPTFRCRKSSCTNFFLDKSCAVNFPHQPRLLNHPCHPKHQLTITILRYNHPVPNSTCGACCLGIDSDSSLFAYRCSTDGCEFALHLDCSKLSPSFDCDGHRHLLTLFEKTLGFPCHACGGKCSTFVLRCVPCNFNIHLLCLPSAPTTITHKSHLHSLVLTTKTPLQHELNSEEDAYNPEDDFYCDVCEQKRYKREPVYHCAECKFIAELKCVIKEVVLLLSRSSLLIQQFYVPEHRDDDDGDNNDDDASLWMISKALYKIEKLRKKKIELEKKLELTTRYLQEEESMYEKLVVDAHK